MRYRDLKCNSRSISGQRTGPDGHWSKFVTTPNLFFINLAMDIMPETIGTFMTMADGYGKRGYFPDGYDWSGIRDSSQRARNEMEFQ